MNTTTYLLEELDDATKEYLLAVRDNAGAKMPGVYAPTEQPPQAGCVAAVGATVALLTLLFTLTTWLGVIYDDPARVALLQTAGLLVGGWVATAPLRIKIKSQGAEVAGHWAYVDPLHLYEANGEQLKVTPTTDFRGATYDHSEGKEGEYKHTTVTLRARRKRDEPLTLTVYDAKKAERLVEYVEYLAWARGDEGEDRGDLPPEELDVLARYYVKHGDEPVDAEGNPDPSQGVAARNWPDAIPEQPEGVTKVPPKLVPYAVLLAAGLCCFFVMQEVNVRLRDGAIYDRVTVEPVEPQWLRQYLGDPRNTSHREAVTKRLAQFYAPAVAALKGGGGQPLKEGLAAVLEGVSTAEQPIVSIRTTEADTPPGQEAGKAARAEKVRLRLSSGVAQFLTARTPPLVIPPGMTITPPPPPLGEQMIAFVEAPEDAPAAHVEVRYRFVPTADGRFQVAGRVEVRKAVADPPVGVDEVTTIQSYDPSGLDAGVEEFANLVLQKMTQ